MTTHANSEARSSVDRCILEVIVPDLYRCIDDLLDAAGTNAPKELVIRARKYLPGIYRNSFQAKQKKGE